ncbi:MAG: hypothetical protein CMD99_08415 [Gammaproteobacteria bacterium]|nr:hypothetical protein [Gammaproteobacteria bacterium]
MLRYVKSNVQKRILKNIRSYLNNFRNFDLSDLNLESDENSFGSGAHGVNLAALETLINPSSGDLFETYNSLTVHEAFAGLTRYQAHDPRMWTYYSLTTAMEYSVARYRRIQSDDDEKCATAVIKHLFCPADNRMLKRNNTLARLWWNAEIAKSLHPQRSHDVLKVMLMDTDLRATIVERPTLFASNAARVFVEYCLEKFDENPKHKFFNAPRARSGQVVTHFTYRSAARLLNQLGGYFDLTVMSSEKIHDLLNEKASTYLS